MPPPPDTPIRLDDRSGVPFYRQIIDQVLLAIAKKRLSPGDRLPTVRSLAVDLSINPNTVAKAYRELEILGILSTQQGSGTFVAAREPEAPALERQRALARLCDEFAATVTRQGFDLDEAIDALRERRADQNTRRNAS